MATFDKESGRPRRVKRGVTIAGAILLAYATAGTCAELTGVVTSRRGLPLQHVKVVIKDLNGKVVKTVYTNKNGLYRAGGLAPATYTYTVDGGPVGFHGGNETVAHLPPDGLNINWTMTSNNAMATASAENPTAFQVGTDNVSGFFTGMPGPLGSTSNSPSNQSNNGSSTDPTGSTATSGPNGPGVPGGPSGVVGGVPVGAVIVPVSKSKNNPTPTPPVSPSQ